MSKYMISTILIGLITIISCTNSESNKHITISDSQYSENTQSSSSLPAVDDKINSESNKVQYLTTNDFKNKVFDYTQNQTWVYNHKLPCIVDFYADWCRPCKMVAPIMDKIAKDYSGKINVYKVDTDKEREVASAFGINSIPSILFCPVNGQPQMTQGVMSEEDYKKIIEEYLLK